MEETLKTILENWQMVFLYGLKYLGKIERSLSSIKTVMELHEKRLDDLEGKPSKL